MVYLADRPTRIGCGEEGGGLRFNETRVYQFRLFVTPSAENLRRKSRGDSRIRIIDKYKEQFSNGLVTFSEKSKDVCGDDEFLRRPTQSI